MIRKHDGHAPAIAASAYVDPSAQVIGKVTLGERTSVWCNTTLRGDVNTITVGDDSNIQDNSCLHVDRDAPLVIGKNVVVGHSVTLHGCTVGDDCLIGMGAIVLSHARIGAGSIVAAGALVTEGTHIPPNSLVMGTPARIVRPVDAALRTRIAHTWAHYVEQAERHRAGTYPPWNPGAGL